MNASKIVLATVSLISLLQLSNPVQAATVSIHPTADTTLQEAFSNNNFGDGTTFTAGGRRQGGRSRALLLFDIAGNIPAGATINSVTLTLSCLQDPSGGVNSVFDVNRLTASWGEGNGSDHGGTAAGSGQATWNNRFGSSGSPWATAGGDFLTTASGSRSVTGTGNYTFTSTAALVADVQGWLNAPASDFGWLLRSESELTATTIRRFGSRDSGASAPTLTISYTPIPEPNTLSILGLGLLALAWRSRR